MTGLDIIISRIQDEATTAGESKVRQAKKEAEGIIAEAQNKAADLLKAKDEKSGNAAKVYVERAKSSADLRRRTSLLQAKQELISQVIDKALARLAGLDDGAYFETLLKMLKSYAQPEEGILYLSAEDKKRMPADFPEKMAEAAKENGGALTLASETKEIENGFILVYGGVEENCTFKALVNSKKEMLQDIVNKELFA